ncbi:MAPEG family protein [Aestuariivirga sp.]|uniref:MAPEG family protein n=1 Tax=Aestuariivirga sp. TaxID=2650926 RepID=UPI0039E31BFB
MTPVQLLMAPIFVHVALTAWVGARTIRARIAAVRAGEARMKEIAVDTKAWPVPVRLLGNNFDNQFDVPMMWYGCCAMIVATRLADWALGILSCLFVLTRIVHAAIHTGSNDIPMRMRSFLAGFAVLAVMWVWFGIRLFMIG